MRLSYTGIRGFRDFIENFSGNDTVLILKTKIFGSEREFLNYLAFNLSVLRAGGFFNMRKNR